MPGMGGCGPAHGGDKAVFGRALRSNLGRAPRHHQTECGERLALALSIWSSTYWLD